MKTLISKIVDLSVTQVLPLAGQLSGREQALADTVAVTLVVAGQVKCFARTEKRADLDARVTLTRSDFVRMRRSEQMNLAQRVHDDALPLLTELIPYGVTAAVLEDLQARITATDEAVDAPVDLVADRKVATAELVVAFAEVEELLLQIDLLVAPLKLSDAKTYTRYEAARQIYDRGHGHGAPEGATATAGTPVVTATATTAPANVTPMATPTPAQAAA